MAKAIQITQYGSAELLKLKDVELPKLLSAEARFRVLAAAVNRADIEIRSGNWPIMAANPFPYTPGLEAYGEVVEIGDQVSNINIGDRVITMMQKLGGIHGIRPGGYQEFVTVEAEKLAVVPAALDGL